MSKKIRIFIVILLITVSLFANTQEKETIEEILPTVLDDPALPSQEILGHLLHLETFGNEKNQTIIIIHGGPGGDYLSLLPLKALSDEYFLVFYDQLGAGLSQRVSGDELSLQYYLEELDTIVDLYSQGKQVNLIGHSWGGSLVSAYLGYAPEKVDQAVMAEPGYLNAAEKKEWEEYYHSFMSGDEYMMVAYQAGVESYKIKGPDAYAQYDFLVGNRILPYFLNHEKNPYHCKGKAYTAPFWRFGAVASDTFGKNTPDEALDSISSHAPNYNKPLLFIASECNTWLGVPLQKKHVEMYPNALLEVIPDAGHNMFWDNPEDSLVVIRDFFSN